ncbi:hypothetical protein EG68_11971 [Paragonimus skrjabini miyazakii]|uniref:DOP1 N-terminal domain-containing protein n=1 Tax=Paragonimus skrjabini miyazakii TaxID=59628 RepID=A0A8S9YFA5_9TREM|nr:hypothetical protein EG68_11971 [Paragonimus skrjabini miyazakii]
MSSEDFYNSNDSKFKSFTAQIDKSLKGFEYSTEWADLISALGRLIKVIQSNAKTGYVPRSFLIGKRIAQCLHPALPPGVHCKALECYDAIFRTIGLERLALDLPIYGSGLFALLGLSAMTVKPPLFDIFEEHLLPLGTSLHPAFMGLLQGILPGLEQGAEFSERGNRMMEMFCAAVGPKFFYTCLWKLLIDVPSVRHFGISFVINRFNKRKSIMEQDFIYGLDRHILLESLCCLFGDSVLLVQRDALDFLQIALPIHLHASSSMTIADGPLSAAELSALCSCALSILLQRDASLNRRLFAWLRGSQLVEIVRSDCSSVTINQPVSLALSVLGDSPKLAEYIASQPHPSVENNQVAQNCYFSLYSRDILIDAVRRIIRSPTSLSLQNPSNQIWIPGHSTVKSLLNNMATERNIAERPFRIVTGLLDRSDLGGSIIECLLPEILWYTYAQFHVLQQRSDAWFSNDAATLIGSDMLCQFKMRTVNDATECEQSAVENISNMIMDHVRAKDSTKPLSLRKFVNTVRVHTCCVHECTLLAWGLVVGLN